MTPYQQLLQHPLWQKKRLEVLDKAGWRCQCCKSDQEQLHAHHIFYRKDAKPWEYEEGEIISLCDECHELEHDYGDPAWRHLKRSLIAAGCFHDSAAYLADAFGSVRLASHEWQALMRCIQVVIATSNFTGADFSDIARGLKKSFENTEADAGRDDVGYDAWVASGGLDTQKEQILQPVPSDGNPF